MKSDDRKRTAHNKTGATAKDSKANDVSVVVADVDYAAQMFKAADALEPLSGRRADTGGALIEVTTPNIEASETQMTNVKQQDNFVHAIVLPEQCMMRDAVELKSQLLSVLDAEALVPIDVSKVKRIDAAAVQVLLAFVRDRGRGNRDVEWLGMNDVMLDAAKTLGLHSVLRMPAEGEAA